MNTFVHKLPVAANSATAWLAVRTQALLRNLPWRDVASGVLFGAGALLLCAAAVALRFALVPQQAADPQLAFGGFAVLSLAGLLALAVAGGIPGGDRGE